MSELNEDSLDRHFASQLQMVSDVFIRSICAAHHDIIHSWLLVFYEAPPPDKYARNCLMVLLHSQLKGMGELGKPFTDLSNTKLPLEEVLCRYEMDSAQEVSSEKKLPSEYEPEEAKSDCDTNYTSYGDVGNRSYRKLSNEEKSSFDYSQSSDKGKSDYELQSENNKKLLEEVKALHARTIQNEQHYKKSDTNWQKRISQSYQPRHGQTLVQQVERNIRHAIRRLKDWNPNSGPLNFLLIILQDLLDDKPKTRRLLMELDHKLESVLDNLLEFAGERREKNVRIIYDQLFKQQQDLLQAKHALLQHEQEALAETRQQLQAQEQTRHYKKKVTPTRSNERQQQQSNSCDCSQCQANLSPSMDSSSSLLVHVQRKM